MFEMTANPAGAADEEAGHEGGGVELNITTYGESNLVAEPQKVSAVVLLLRVFLSKPSLWCTKGVSP